MKTPQIKAKAMMKIRIMMLERMVKIVMSTLKACNFTTISIQACSARVPNHAAASASGKRIGKTVKLLRRRLKGIRLKKGKIISTHLSLTSKILKSINTQKMMIKQIKSSLSRLISLVSYPATLIHDLVSEASETRIVKQESRSISRH